MNQKVYLNEESKERLYKIMTKSIVAQTEVIDSLRENLRVIKKSEDLGYKYPVFEESVSRMGEYNILLGLAQLDILCAYRYYLKAELPYEIQYATKNLIITIKEAFHKIYGYIVINKKTGDEVMKLRNDSFWKKDIEIVVRKDASELTSKYAEITVELDEFENNHAQFLKDLRDIFVHYNDNPSKLVDALIKLDIEEVTNIVNPFLKILEEMFHFMNDLFKYYNSSIKNSK